MMRSQAQASRATSAQGDQPVLAVTWQGRPRKHREALGQPQGHRAEQSNSEDEHTHTSKDSKRSFLPLHRVAMKHNSCSAYEERQSHRKEKFQPDTPTDSHASDAGNAFSV